MPFLAPPPPAVIVPGAQKLPPLSFIGFRAGMPVAEVKSFLRSSRVSLDCKRSSDPRMKECTATLPLPGVVGGLAILISSVNDSAAVLVFTARGMQRLGQQWEMALTEDFGKPKREDQPGIQTSWQWIRKGQMMRVVQRKAESMLECSVTLTDGPLLDGLGPPRLKRPD